MKRLFLFVLIGFGIVSAQAQTPTQNVSLKAPRPKVGVVLGGGGAKGASHIGALKYIEEMGIPIDYVAGTSMGSIIGGLYAMGYSPDELTRLISNMNWSEYIGNKIDRSSMSQETRERNSTTLVNVSFNLNTLFDNDPNTKFINSLPSAYVNNSSLINLFNDLCIGYQEDMDFNDLPIPFACVATNIVTGEEVVFRNGNVPTAMRASMAIPGVFSPVSIGDMVLVDGGLVNNFPADVLKEMGADIIIGVEVTSEKKITHEDIQSLPQLLGRLVTNSTNSKRKENRELCNIHIVPDISGFGMLSFTPEAIDTLVNRGYKKAAEYHDELLTIKQHLDRQAGYSVGKELHAAKAYNLLEDSVLISSIEFNNVNESDSRWLMRKGGLKVGNTYNKDEIEHAISVYRGAGCFDEITYNVKEHDSIHSRSVLSETYDLSINMTPAKPHVVGLGLRYDTDEGAALLINIGLNEKKFGGSKLNLLGKLSFNPRFNATYTYSHPSLANFNVAYDFRNEHFGLYTSGTSLVNLHFIQHKVSGYISQFHLLNFNTSVGAYYAYLRFDSSSIETENLYDSLFFNSNRFITPFVTLKYDNLDNAYFANRGIYTRLASHLYIEPGNNAPLTFDICYAFKAYITPDKGKFTIIPQFYGRSVFNTPFHFNIWNQVGGEIEGRHFEEQLPFIGCTQLLTASDHTAVLRCDLRYNIYGKHYLTAMYNALLELYDNIEGQYYIKPNHGAGLKYSYNSLIGPISLTGQWSSVTKTFGVYFSFGYTF